MPVVINLLSLTSNNNPTSVFINNKKWRKLFASIIKTNNHYNTLKSDCMTTFEETFNQLWSILQNRMTDNLRNFVMDTTKHKHWFINWSRNNVSRFCSMVVLLGHVKTYLFCVGIDSTLLKTPSSDDFFLLTTSPHVRVLEGSYLYYDCVNGNWVCSGKVVGKGKSFFVKHKENENSSMKSKSGKSLLYKIYPHQESDLSCNVMRKAFFYDLDKYCGIGFNITSKNINLLTKMDGILFWDEECMEKISSVKNYGSRNMSDKKLFCFSHMCEFLYNVMISPLHNVSLENVMNEVVGI